MAFIVKNTTFSGLADMICPHSCIGCGVLGTALCECCKKDILLNHTNYCPNCKRLITQTRCEYCQLPPSFMVGWRDDLVGRLVHELKYHSTRVLAGELAEILAEILPTIDGEVAVVPLPTIRRHVRERGLNHTVLIAKKLARKRGWAVKNILTRTKDTVQVGTDELTRRAQAKEAYGLSGEKIDPEMTYVLFDDVWTTGASMRAALKKLRKAGAVKIVIAVLAVNRVQH